MTNCAAGDIAVIIWDELPVLSNIGKLVRVYGPPGNDRCFGPAWQITPVNHTDGFVFINGWDDDNVKLWEPGDEEIWHPDAWLRPLTETDDSGEEFTQEVDSEAKTTSRQEEPVAEICD